MKPVKIAVSTKEPGLAKDLARGLSELGKHFIIEVLEGNLSEKTYPETQRRLLTDAEVLVTDQEEKNVSAAGFEPSEVVWLEETSLRISRIYKKIMDIVSEKRDGAGSAYIFGGNGAEAGETARILSFFSRQGGSGVTSLAVTAGRMLSGMYGEKVLYICTKKEDDSLMYRCSTGGDGLLQELRYRLKNRRPIYLDRFTERDDYGLEYLRISGSGETLAELKAEEMQPLLQEIGEAGGYEWILLDTGVPGSMPDWGMPVEICNTDDSRCWIQQAAEEKLRNPEDCRETGIRGIQIWNRCTGKECLPQTIDCLFEIPYDRESFLCAEDSWKQEMGQNCWTDISMYKTFAAGVRNLIAWLMKDRSLSNLVEPW